VVIVQPGNRAAWQLRQITQMHGLRMPFTATDRVYGMCLDFSYLGVGPLMFYIRLSEALCCQAPSGRHRGV